MKSIIENVPTKIAEMSYTTMRERLQCRVDVVFSLREKKKKVISMLSYNLSTNGSVRTNVDQFSPFYGLTALFADRTFAGGLTAVLIRPQASVRSGNPT